MFEIIKSLLKQGKYFLFINVLDRAVSFVVFLILAKSLSPFVYGQIVTVFAVTSIVAAIFDFGLPIYIQRESAHNKNLNEVYLQTGLLKLLLSLVYLAASIFIFLFFPGSIDWYVIVIIILTVFFVSMGTSLQFYHHGRDNSKQVFISSLAAKIILLTITGAAFIIYPNKYLFLCGYLAANAFFALHLLIRLKIYKVIITNILMGKKFLSSTFKTVLPLGFASIFNILYDRIDIVLLSLFLSYSKVAQYNVAYMIFKIGAIAFGVFLFPALNNLTIINNDKVKLLSLLKKLGVIIITASVFLTIIFYFVVPKILLKVFGFKYLEASQLLPLLSFAIILIGLNNLTGVVLNAIGKFKANMIATFSGVSINISLNLILIPLLNTLGAVYATIVTESAILIVDLIFIYKFFNEKNYSLKLGSQTMEL